MGSSDASSFLSSSAMRSLASIAVQGDQPGIRALASSVLSLNMSLGPDASALPSATAAGVTSATGSLLLYPDASPSAAGGSLPRPVPDRRATQHYLQQHAMKSFSHPRVPASSSDSPLVVCYQGWNSSGKVVCIPQCNRRSPCPSSSTSALTCTLVRCTCRLALPSSPHANPG